MSKYNFYGGPYYEWSRDLTDLRYLFDLLDKNNENYVQDIIEEYDGEYYYYDTIEAIRDEMIEEITDAYKCCFEDIIKNEDLLDNVMTRADEEYDNLEFAGFNYYVEILMDIAQFHNITLVFESGSESINELHLKEYDCNVIVNPKDTSIMFPELFEDNDWIFKFYTNEWRWHLKESCK